MSSALSKKDFMLQDLNTEQRTIVETQDRYVLVLAGAGSGKTRVLIHRISWLITQHLIFPSKILAVTFSNKAAQEMRARLKNILPEESIPSWIGTFHGICHKILRCHPKETGLGQHFQILDGDDQLRLVKRLIKDARLDSTQWSPKRVLNFIQKQKDRFLPPQLGSNTPLHERQLQTLYAEYQKMCLRSDLLDFTDLILRTLHLWNTHPEVLIKYQNKFHTILIDEFQDTDNLQYLWLRTLAGKASNIMAVGDDDQCIYGWRGAQIKNLFQFQEDFENVNVLRLEQNYRSSPEILKAANALISHNAQRFGKNLWSCSESGEKISLYVASSELDEAYFVAETIYRFSKQKISASKFAVLYRTNAQSRVIEEALLRLQLPYKIYGGVRFFDRQEIKDALAYLRLILNLNDDDAFERILNLPPRGIGEKTVEEIRQCANSESCSLWIGLQKILMSTTKSLKKNLALRQFSELILSLEQLCLGQSLSEKLRIILEYTGLKKLYDRPQNQDPFGFNNKLENLFELLNAATYFQQQIGTDDIDLKTPEDIASKFLMQAALDQAHLHLETVQEQKPTAQQEGVNLMTLHAVKGLEFEYVFIIGCEEGIFPSELSKDIPERIEEERRLAYVGLTRAKKYLYLSRAEKRSWHGRTCRNAPSRFLSELPVELVHSLGNLRLEDDYSLNNLNSDFIKKKEPIVTEGFKIGQKVRHAKFGLGVVTETSGSGQNLKVSVTFKSSGHKHLLASVAKLELIS